MHAVLSRESKNRYNTNTMNALSLTAEEQKMFDGLPDKLKEGWEVQEERGSYQDSPEKLSTRLALLRVHDPKLLEFQKKAAGLSAEKLSELIAKTDLTGVPLDGIEPGSHQLKIIVKDNLGNESTLDWPFIRR